MKEMIPVYVNLIKNNLKKETDVPKKIKADVEKITKK